MLRIIPNAETKRKEVIARYVVEVQQAIALESRLIENLSHPIIVFICEAIDVWDGSHNLVIQVPPEAFWKLAEVNRAIIINLFKDKGYTADIVPRKESKTAALVLIIGKTL